MREDKFILDDNGNPVPCSDLMVWAKWMATTSRILKVDIIDGIRVSTVFLGLNHRFSGGPPLLYETMIFGGHYDQHQERYVTKEEALKGHEVALDLVKGNYEKENKENS